MTKTEEQYLKHEVAIRVHDHKFKLLDNKLNYLLGLMISNLILPAILKHFGL